MPRRKNSLRLKGYDYSYHGAYFVAMVTKTRQFIFGEIIDSEMVINDLGKIVNDVWLDLPNHYNIYLDEFVIMPNHVHGIIWINDGGLQNSEIKNHIVVDAVGAVHEPPLRANELRRGQSTNSDVAERRRMLIPQIIGRFKMVSGKHINSQRNTPGIPVWQRGFHDHIIRSEDELNNICAYIQTNPKRWAQDAEIPL